MAFVRLTNLGNLTLQNLLRIKERYGPNHELKRRRWAKLWEPQEDMDTFQRLFTSYHAGSIDQIVVRDGDSFYIKQRSGSAYPLTSNKKSLDRFKALGLISFSDTSMSFDRMVGEVENDRQTNPALTLGTVHVELTGMCNSDCTYCHRGGPKPSEYGLSVGMIKDGLNPLLRAGIELVVFTGGEPTLRRDDTLELISYLSEFLELNGLPQDEWVTLAYGSSTPTVDDVRASEIFKRKIPRLVAQLEDASRDFPADLKLKYEADRNHFIDHNLTSEAEFDIEHPKYEIHKTIDHISILSNGQFDDQRPFVRALKSFNVGLVVTLDSFEEELMDHYKGRPGSFTKVRNLAIVCREEGYHIDITYHNFGDHHSAEAERNNSFFRGFVTSVGNEPSKHNFGRAARGDFQYADKHSRNNTLGALKLGAEGRYGWCYDFTEPISLWIRPTGNVGNCMYGYVFQEEYGNLRKMRMVDIVNGMQDTGIFKMAAAGMPERLQHELDPALFPRVYKRSCEPFVAALAYGMEKNRLIAEGSFSPVEEANPIVARACGFCK